MTPYWSEEYFQRFSEGVAEGERRSEELWKQRCRRHLIVGILIGIGVGIVGYVEFLTTFGVHCAN